MSIEELIAELTCEITKLNTTLSLQNSAHTTISKDASEGYGASTSEAGTGQVFNLEEALTPKQIAGKKAAATRKANKEAKAKAELAAEQDADPLGEELVSEVETDPEIDFLDSTVEDDDFLDIDDTPKRLTVMDQKDPRAALRRHLAAISKLTQAADGSNPLPLMMKEKFGTVSFAKIQEAQFDDFLEQAMLLVPEDKRHLLG